MLLAFKCCDLAKEGWIQLGGYRRNGFFCASFQLTSRCILRRQLVLTVIAEQRWVQSQKLRPKPRTVDSAENGRELTDSEKAHFYQAALRSLQIQLADRSDETCKATGDRRQMQQQLSEMQRQLEEASEGAYDITRDMTRQYKGMQEELLNRINQLEGSIQ
eukprot:8759-Heterococcus_DN1.PRE.1